LSIAAVGRHGRSLWEGAMRPKYWAGTALIAASMLFSVGVVFAQVKLPRIGFLALARFIPPKLFLEDLEKQGFVESRNILIEYSFADGRHDQMRSLAADLVRSHPDIILANGDQAVVAAMAETKTIPIVMLSCDAVAMGFVKSLAHPGGNVTGVTCISNELSARRVQIFKEAVPNLSNLAVIYNPENVAKPSDAQNTIAAAKKLGIEAYGAEVREVADLEPAFASALRNGANGVIVLSEAFTLTHRKAITDLALRHHLPDMHVYREFVDAGGLISYGPNVQGMLRQTARHVAGILRGTPVGDLPVEQPIAFDFLVNLKRAKALEMTVPTATLLQATEILE
jgi:putative ABC transport system substrate-binding protein